MHHAASLQERAMSAELQRAYAAGKFAEAVALARTAGAALDDSAAALSIAVNAAIQAGALDDAECWLLTLRDRHQDDARLRRLHASVLNRLGIRETGEGQHEAARTLLQRALQLDPEHAEATFNLALEWRHAGKDELALPLLLQLGRRADPDEAVNLHLAECAIRLGELSLAADRLRLQAQHGFGSPDRWRGIALQTDVDELWPQLLDQGSTVEITDASSAAAMVLVERGRRDAAIELADLVGRHRGHAAPTLRARLAAMLHFPPVTESAAQIESLREQWQQAVRDLEKLEIDRCEPRLAQLCWSNFGLAYHGCDDRELQSAYGDWLARNAPRMRADLVSATRTPGRRARVLLVSGHWYECTAGNYFESWVEGLSADPELDVQVLAIGPRFDALTDRIATHAAVTRLPGLADSDVIAEAIVTLAPDLLLFPELGMDTRLFPVAALRLAPVQAMAWGHPVTSGLPTIDAYLSCAGMEPVGAQAHYREALHLLPGLGTNYRAPPRPRVPTRLELGLPSGPLIVVPQSALKIHPDNDAIYREILAGSTGTALLFFENENSLATAQLRDRIGRGLRSGQQARIHFHPLCSREQFLGVLGAGDLMLDTLHWSGGNTALDALRMGLPILSSAGAFMRGRQCMAMLQSLGLDDPLLCHRAEMADRANRLLTGTDLSGLRSRIERQFDSLLDGRDALVQLRKLVHELLALSPKVLS